MIRVRKNAVAPSDLPKCGYSADAVKSALLFDQYGKCYLCEREVGTDYQVEHLKSRHLHPELENDWANLFMACSYCNDRKSDSFDDILDPADANIEQLISQTYDSKSGKFVFKSVGITSKAVDRTVALLERLFNGIRPGMPNLKERRFRSEFMASYNAFVEKLNLYLESMNSEHRESVERELSIGAEYLGFKYWIIKSIPILEHAFLPMIVWNRK